MIKSFLNFLRLLSPSEWHRVNSSENQDASDNYVEIRDSQTYAPRYEPPKSFVNTPFPDFVTQDEEIIYVLNFLSSIGIKLNPILSIQNLKETDFWGDWELEQKRGVQLAIGVFFMMGAEARNPIDRKEYVKISEDVWVWKYKPGDAILPYDEFLKSLNKLVGNKFSFQEIENKFNPTNGTSGIAFSLNYQKYDIELEFRRGRTDINFIIKVGAIIKPYLDKNVYFASDSDSGLVLYMTHEDMLNLASFLNFKWDLDHLI